MLTVTLPPCTAGPLRWPTLHLRVTFSLPSTRKKAASKLHLRIPQIVAGRGREAAAALAVAVVVVAAVLLVAAAAAAAAAVVAVAVAVWCAKKKETVQGQNRRPSYIL